MKYVKKYLSIIILFLISLFVFCGCGASIDTKMEIDKEFKGARIIDVTIEKSDLDEYVTGGEEALKQVADANIPKEMTYSVSSGEENTVMTFQVEFEDVDDYAGKVKSIISAGSNKEIKPEIQYENMDTFFKKGVYFRENFNSEDLLQWYFDALNEAQIISESDQSNWASLGDSQCIIDGKEYEVYSELSVDEQDYCCLDTLEVETTLNIDGTIARKFHIGAYETTIENLKERGCLFDDYVKDLVPEGDSIVLEENADNGDDYKEYIITINAKKTEELTKKTNQILQSENAFSLDIKENKESPGMAKVYLTEKLDGSYYLDYRTGNGLTSIINTYTNSSIATESVVHSDEITYFEEDQLVYYPSYTGVQEFVFDWKIGFATVELDTDIKNRGKNITVKFIFTSEKNLDDELKKEAINALKKSCDKYGNFKENDDKCILSFTGSVQEVCKNINAFLKANDKESGQDDDYFNIEILASETPNKFLNSFNANIYYNLTPIVGRQPIIFRNVESFYKQVSYNGNFSQDANGNNMAASEDIVTITQSKLSIVMLVVCGVGVLCLVFGILILMLNMKKIKRNIAEKRESKVQQHELNTANEHLEENGHQVEQNSADNGNMEDDLL